MPEVSTSTSTAPPAATLVNKPTPAAQQSRPAPSKPAAPTKGPAHPIYPIESLSPYQNKWTIKARVTQKSEIRSFSTQKGEGKLFNMTLMDETGEIRATAFNTVVDDLYDRVEEGKVYFISKARVNIAKKKFASSTTDFEISLERNTEIEEVRVLPQSPTSDVLADSHLRTQCKDVTNVPLVKFDFKELGKLEEVENNTICGMCTGQQRLMCHFAQACVVIDVIGIVSEAGELAELTSKAGKQVRAFFPGLTQFTEGSAIAHQTRHHARRQVRVQHQADAVGQASRAVRDRRLPCRRFQGRQGRGLWRFVSPQIVFNRVSPV